MREVGVVYRTDILLLGGLYMYCSYTEVSHNSTLHPCGRAHMLETVSHILQRCHMTLQLVHMFHSLYYLITTALHKDAMLYNGIVPGTLRLTMGIGP